MSLPKKITQDFLRDSIVEINYTSDIMFELYVGVLYKELIKDFTLEKKLAQNSIFRFDNTGFSLGTPNAVFTFLQDDFVLQIKPGSFVFNTNSEYSGWKKYYPFIKKTLRRIFKNENIKSVNRVGVRYISEFPNVEIFGKLRGKLEPLKQNSDLKNTTFRTEFLENTQTVVVNLANNVQRNAGFEDSDFYSLIDIDVYERFSDTDDLKYIFSKIDALHATEKDVFFDKLLDKEYVATLNPEY